MLSRAIWDARRVLIDKRIYANNLLYDTFQKVNLGGKDMKTVSNSLLDFIVKS